MEHARRILTFQIRDQIRNKWLIGYFAAFFLLTQGLIVLQGDANKVLVNVVHLLLILIPLFSLLFGILYAYQSRPFVEILLSQPLSRGLIFVGLFGGIAIPLATAFATGVGLPILFNGSLSLVWLAAIGVGTALAVIFSGIAVWISLKFEDRLKGFAWAIAIWFGLALCYDGFVLYIVYAFSDYPLEPVLMGLSALNPISLGRSLLLLQMETSALMGYTGSVVQTLIGSKAGVILTGAALCVWSIVPILRGRSLFYKKDF